MSPKPNCWFVIKPSNIKYIQRASNFGGALLYGYLYRMKAVAIIPARFASTRFPAKLLADLGGAPVIVQTYRAVQATGLFAEVWVVTDHDDIENAVTQAGALCFRSTRPFESGSDRIAELAAQLDADLIFNVQGDEPFVDTPTLQALLDVFYQDAPQQIDLASVMRVFPADADVSNPNQVKVVVDQQGRALYFSRSPIPFNRDAQPDVTYFHHIGVYAFRRQALLDFTSWPEGTLERIEKLEQLRYLEHGRRIQMVRTTHQGIGIDTPDDLALARQRWTN